MRAKGNASFENIARAALRGDVEILDEEEEARRRETPTKKIPVAQVAWLSVLG